MRQWSTLCRWASWRASLLAICLASFQRRLIDANAVPATARRAAAVSTATLLRYLKVSLLFSNRAEPRSLGPARGASNLSPNGIRGDTRWGRAEPGIGLTRQGWPQ